MIALDKPTHAHSWEGRPDLVRKADFSHRQMGRQARAGPTHQADVAAVAPRPAAVLADSLCRWAWAGFGGKKDAFAEGVGGAGVELRSL
jgi:hypothetical protein